MQNFSDIYKASITSPDEFWGKEAQKLRWQKKFTQVLDDSKKPFYKWFSDGNINICDNAVDRHVDEGRGDNPAIIYDSPVTNTKKIYTYKEMLRQVSLLAGVLAKYNVKKGDRVVVYMPMIPQALFAMLACARIGAIHSVVFGGFAADQLAVRIQDSTAKLVLTASCGVEPGRVVEYKPLLDKALELSKHKPEKCIVFQREQCKATMSEGRDLDWEDEMKNSSEVPCAITAATDELFILYTSGTTGHPKGVVHDIGGYAVALSWTTENLYGVKAGDVFWAASDVGWIVGHSYIVYAPLLCGCATVLFEGKPVGTPDAGAFWRVVEEHKVKILFTAPTAIRAIKKEDPEGELVAKYDLGCLQTFFLAGERCDPDSVHWSHDKLKVPVIDHWWQTETGWAITALPAGSDMSKVKIGSAGVPMVGYDVRIINDEGEEKKAGELGNIMVKLPLPPGTFPTLWQNDEKFLGPMTEVEGFYSTGDAGYKDEDDYVHVMSRTDDVINVAGHRLSTGGMEEVLTGHKEVAEAAVFGIADEIKGQLPLGLVVLSSSATTPPDKLAPELVQLVRDKIGPVAAFKLVACAPRLPKTRSGKILRGTMAKIADGVEWNMPATIDDPASLDEITEVLKQLGYPKN